MSPCSPGRLCQPGSAFAELVGWAPSWVCHQLWAIGAGSSGWTHPGRAISWAVGMNGPPVPFQASSLALVCLLCLWAGAEDRSSQTSKPKLTTGPLSPLPHSSGHKASLDSSSWETDPALAGGGAK